MTRELRRALLARIEEDTELTARRKARLRAVVESKLIGQALSAPVTDLERFYVLDYFPVWYAIERYELAPLGAETADIAPMGQAGARCPRCNAELTASYLGWRDCTRCDWSERKPTDLARRDPNNPSVNEWHES